MQFDRDDRAACASSTPAASACRTRSAPGAYWALLGLGVEHRCTRVRAATPATGPASGRPPRATRPSPISRPLPSDPDLVPVGRVGRPHGVDGSFFVDGPSDRPERFAERRDALRGRRAGQGRRLEAGQRRAARDQARPAGGARHDARRAARGAAARSRRTSTTASSSSGSRSRRRAAASSGG